MRTSRLLAGPLAILCLGAAPAPGPLPAGTTESDASLLRFQVDPADRMTVPISLSKGQVHQFLIDTGAEQSAISTELARNMGYAQSGERRVYSFAGETRVRMVRVPTMTVASNTRGGFDALTFGRNVIGADGLLGIDSLAGQTVNFDFKHRNLVIAKSKGMSDKAGDGEVVVRAKVRNGRLIMSNATANRLRIELVLDTGTSVSIGNAALRRELERTKRLGNLKRIHMLAITGEVVAIDYGLLRQVTIDRNVTIQRMPIAFAVNQPFDRLGLEEAPAILLGMDVLRSFGEVTVDFRNKKVRFKSRDDSQKLPPDRFGFSRNV